MNCADYLDAIQATAARDGLEGSDLQPAQIMDILTLERSLGVDLPEPYEEFLIQVGCGPVYGGLAVWHHLDVTIPGNLVESSRELARQMAQATRHTFGRNKFPKGFLTIYDSCDGDVFGFMPATSSSFRPGVYAWNREDLELRLVAPDFWTFLDYLDACDTPGEG